MNAILNYENNNYEHFHPISIRGRQITMQTKHLRNREWN